MYSALDVSRYIINYSNKHEYNISNLKLQKLLYFVQAYYLAFTESHHPCFRDKIEAWDFGPVVPVAYQEFRKFGSSNIPPVTFYYQSNPGDFWSVKRVPFSDSIIEAIDKKHINAVVEQFVDYSAYDLVRLTHLQKPWKDAYTPGRNNEISIHAIKEYFES